MHPYKNFCKKSVDNIYHTGYNCINIREGGESLTDKKTSDAQMRANKRWKEKNADKVRYMRYKSQAKKFLSELANDEDLKEMQGYIEDRKKLKKD